MQATLLDYLNDAYQLEGTAEIVAIQDEEEGKKSIVLKSTLFYPQGGGQPSDQGCLDSEEARFQVHKVRFHQGIVYHIGEFEKGKMEAGETVGQQVEECQRKVNRINHSAGHLIDVAMLNCGFEFHPTKGYHFPDSPYVEYAGIIEPEQREQARLQLQEEVEQLIGKGGVVNDFVVNDKVALKDHCNYVPDYVPSDKPIRVVQVAGVGCPCGGTHVKDIKEIHGLMVTKVKVKSGKTRINYKVQ